MPERTITQEEFKSICSARDALCDFCENDECDKCIVTRLVDDAQIEYERGLEDEKD